MRFSSFTDYSLRLLMYVALSAGGSATVGEVAERYRISRDHLVKVGNHLNRVGLLRSSRGRGGGFQLARPASEISLADVVRSTEEIGGLVPCESAGLEGADCPLLPACVLKIALDDALRAFMNVLEAYSLADLVKPRHSLARLLGLPAPALKDDAEESSVAPDEGVSGITSGAQTGSNTSRNPVNELGRFAVASDK